jgi:hypothetical protein
MLGHQCYHCKNWVEEGEPHECWTTTEAALTRDLSDDLQDAYERLRETADDFGEQRIYASHKSIMFARKACYFFVRPKRNMLEITFFLGRPIKAPQIRRAVQSSRAKIAHVVHVKHRDEVEAPITEWLQEAYETSDALSERRTENGERRTQKAERRTKNARERRKKKVGGRTTNANRSKKVAKKTKSAKKRAPARRSA